MCVCVSACAPFCVCACVNELFMHARTVPRISPKFRLRSFVASLALLGIIYNNNNPCCVLKFCLLSVSQLSMASHTEV